MDKRTEIQKLATESILFNKCTGIYFLAPRTGKSKIVLDSFKNLNQRILITAPYDTIINSWNSEILKWNYQYLKINIINQRSLDKITSSDYDLICCDEIHSLSEKQQQQLKNLNIPYFGITGSLSDTTLKELNKSLGLTIKFNYSLEQAIADKIISDYKINIITCNLDDTDKYIIGGTKKSPFLTTELKHYQYLSKQFDRFKILAWEDDKFNNVKMNFARLRSQLLYTCKTKINIAKKLISKKDRVLVFTTLTDTADSLCQFAYHSKSVGDNLTKFCNEEIDKLAVVSMVSMGITIPKLKNAICHQLQSSEELAIQKLLRTMNFDLGQDANIDIIVANNTMDESWVKKALLGFDSSKIYYIDSRNIK